jgi:hypothetical protein
VTAVWTAAVSKINLQCNMKTGYPMIDQPILVRLWFELAMKIVKKLHTNVPFRSGHDDEEAPSKIEVVLEDLYKQKTSFEAEKAGQNESALAKKK